MNYTQIRLSILSPRSIEDGQERNHQYYLCGASSKIIRKFNG